MQKVPVKDREIKHYHEVLPKEERPEQGGRYLVSMNDEPTYVADITEFKGGCWAKEFEIKVAHYGFQSLKEAQSGPAADSIVHAEPATATAPDTDAA
jgi:hypothetical protein